MALAAQSWRGWRALADGTAGVVAPGSPARCGAIPGRPVAP